MTVYNFDSQIVGDAPASPWSVVKSGTSTVLVNAAQYHSSPNSVKCAANAGEYAYMKHTSLLAATGERRFTFHICVDTVDTTKLGDAYLADSSGNAEIEIVTHKNGSGVKKLALYDTSPGTYTDLVTIVENTQYRVDVIYNNDTHKFYVKVNGTRYPTSPTLYDYNSGGDVAWVMLGALGSGGALNAWYDDVEDTSAVDVPDPPTALTVDAYGDRHVVLSWTKPVYEGASSVTGYKVYYGTATGPTTLLATVTAPTVTYCHNGTNGTLYYYRVKATNASGDSAYCTETSSTPDCNAPRGLAANHLISTFSLYHKLGVGDDGLPTYRDARTIYGNVETVNIRIKSAKGEVLIASTKITVDGSVDIDETDKVTLSTGETALVLKVASKPAPDTTIWLKEVYT